MKKIDPTVKKETFYIAAFTLIASGLMQAVFLILQMWNLPVLFGNLFGAAVAVFNFFLLGLTVQSATQKEEKQARATMKMSQSLRTVMLFAAAAIGALLPCFQIVSTLLPLLFPRIAIAFRPLFMKKENRNDER